MAGNKLENGEVTQVKLMLPPDAHEKLREASSASGATMSELVNFMIEHFLDTSAELLTPPGAGDERIEEAKARVRTSSPARAPDDFVGS